MADKEIRNGQREYGIVHVVEEEMRANGDGVFGSKARAGAPENKDAGGSLSSMTKAQLIEAATAEGVAIETDDNKADLIAKIEKARK